MPDPVILGAGIIRRQIQNQTFKTLEDLMTAAMTKAQDSQILWFGNEDQKFRSALGAILMLAKDEDKPRIEHELKLLAQLTASLAGTPVDMSATVMNEYEPIGLQRLWDKLRGRGINA